MKKSINESYEREYTISSDTYERIRDFNSRRDWDQFHNPKDLAISINLEAAELLECFQWSGTDLTVNDKKERLKEETADILIYALQLCQVINADPEKIIKDKLTKNEKKYPAEKAFGKSVKYTELNKGSIKG